MKASKARHYTQQLYSTRLRGVFGHSDHPHDEFDEVLRKFLKHNPTSNVTAQIARDEWTLHLDVLKFFEKEGYRDASHANDTPEQIMLPPIMQEGSQLTEDLRAAVERLSIAEQQQELSITDVATTTAMRGLGLFMLGFDEEAARMIHHSRILDSDPTSLGSDSCSSQIEYHASQVILAAVIRGLALERIAMHRGDRHLRTALDSYSRAIALHDRLRGNDARRGGLTNGFVDEIERWIEIALYRTVLLTMRLQGSQKGIEALRIYQAKEQRWPSTFRMPQRNVLRNIQATQLNQARTSVPNGVAVKSSVPAIRTTSKRRVRPEPPADKPTSAWTQEFQRMKQAAIRALEQTASFPRADDSNANVDQLANQLVLSWRLDDESDAASADEVVDLLYGMTRITYRSQTILRQLVWMLVAADALEEASQVANKYALLVESTWQAVGVPINQNEMHQGRTIDSALEYIETILQVIYVELHKMKDVKRAHTRANRLMKLVGRFPDHTTADKEHMEGSLPTIEVSSEWLARILRAAGTTAFAIACNALPSRRSESQREAIALLREATQLDAEAAESHYALALALAQTQQCKEALISARYALELEPSSIDAWHLIVLLLSANQDYQGALQLAEAALSQADSDEAADAKIPMNGMPSRLTHLVSYDYPPSAWERGASYVRLFSTYNVLIEITDGVQAALENQCELFEAFRARFSVATSVPGQRRSRDVATDSVPHLNGNPIHELTATPAEARQAYRSQTERCLLQSLWLMSAASFRRANDLEQSRDAIQEAENLNPTDPYVWVQLALWCVDAQKPGAAVTCLYKALACETDHVSASLHLARLLLRPEALHLRASHAESITAVATAQNGAESLLNQSLLDEGIESDLVAEARKSTSLSLGANAQTAASGNVAPAFAWKQNPTLAPLSVAAGLLRTATLYRGYDSPEAWHLLAQLSKQTGQPIDIQRKQLQTALKLQETRPVRPWRIALAWP
ncbi:hypothetical protein MPSI1_001751 [Malassezia psittaci]|uniref:Uncharacterized protein n=1 Tax=Malassezia psittaci TaxID=1821823 RepID=A0AAF0F5C5_9BASI|nr:hypothetical protein MPSI1_001751 [Malassezia psittaci]